MTDLNPAPQSNRKTALADDFRQYFSGDAPLADKAKAFAKARPFTTAVFGLLATGALLQSLRGARG